MNNFRIQISESFIFRTVDPMFLDEVLKELIPVFTKHSFRSTQVCADLAARQDKFKLELQLPMNMVDPIVLASEKLVNIKVLLKDKILFLSDDKYELLYSFTNKVLSINIHDGGESRFFRMSNISDLGVLSAQLGKYMKEYITPPAKEKGVVNKTHPMGGGNSVAEVMRKKVSQLIGKESGEAKPFGGEIINTAQGQNNPLNDMIQATEMSPGTVGQ